MNATRSPSGSAGPPWPAGSDIMDKAAWKAVACSLGLSRRQVQIVRAVFDDAVEFAIADDLAISRHTVHTHLERIYRKLGVHDRVELVVMILGEFLRLTAGSPDVLPPLCARCARGECPFHPGGRRSK